MRELQHDHTIDHTLPTRHERLRAFTKLKSQRQVLTAGIAILGAAALTLGGALSQQYQTPDPVKLGKGVASVDAQPVAALDPVATVPSVAANPDPMPSASESPIGSGDASYYGNDLAGNRTASGEIFDPSRLTAAHRTLPLGSEVRVTNWGQRPQRSGDHQRPRADPWQPRDRPVYGSSKRYRAHPLRHRPGQPGPADELVPQLRMRAQSS
jgi:hypothetical protein